MMVTLLILKLDFLLITMLFDFPQNAMSFLLYDRDVNWQLQSDDFMGSCSLCMNIVSDLEKRFMHVFYVLKISQFSSINIFSS